MRRWRSGSPPPWWPSGEPWPPTDAYRRHARGRSRFLARLALLAVLTLALSGIGASTLVSLALHDLPQAARAGAAAALITVAVLAFAAAMRRVGLPLGDVVAAADRVALGDFSARVAERGPRFLRTVARAFNSMATRLQDEDRQRRELLADIAHELRTPLAVMQGRLEGLLDGVYARDDRSLAEILEETRMLTRLVEDLGTLAHAERGVLGLRREATDLTPLLHDVARAMAAEAQAHGATLHVEERADLTLVEADPLRLREVLTNLVSNAIRHSPAGTAVTLAATPGKDRVTVEVRDTGPGIAREELARIFDRFHKSAGSPGSGLGLPIARKLVEAHGGEISVTSEVGRGTIVRFTIPTAPREA
ncbi:MAG TPA: HAMP domain-containing sensor histidine kinase [Vicinamibacteria bacterium]|nr:HAMP domain-containing sensor histidine kinase [Vicinamibacteria bacterium]